MRNLILASHATCTINVESKSETDIDDKRVKANYKKRA